MIWSYLSVNLIMDSSARQAMLGGDQDKPKILADNSLEPDWLTAGYKMERREMWWDTNKKARYDRNFCGTLVNIFYFFILITELILWIKVRKPIQLSSSSSMTRSKSCFVEKAGHEAEA